MLRLVLQPILRLTASLEVDSQGRRVNAIKSAATVVPTVVERLWLNDCGSTVVGPGMSTTLRTVIAARGRVTIPSIRVRYFEWRQNRIHIVRNLIPA